MGKTQSKHLAARHGRGKALVRHGNRMVCGNLPLWLGIVTFKGISFVSYLKVLPLEV
jgi:hypothetical protein